MRLKLFLIKQDANRDYDTYDAAVVAAPNEEVARTMHPRDGRTNWEWYSDTWCSTPEQVEVEYLGYARPGAKQGVILASFNAG